MIVTTWGTRGSTPVAGPGMVKYGGNTTCVEVDSACLPQNMRLCVDGGTGFVPYGKEVMKSIRIRRELGKFEGRLDLVVLFTHYHWDHIQGIPLSPVLYAKNDTVLHFFGPDDAPKGDHYLGGPKEALTTLLNPPYFPVSFHQIGEHIRCQSIVLPQETIIAFHPTGGKVMLSLDKFEDVERRGETIEFSSQIHNNGSFPIRECLIVKMYRSNHPERTISYRFEERPTGKVFVFLTDHEATAAFPADLLRHVKNANLLIEDAQYLVETYELATSGFGHGTGPYCVKLAKAAGGVTHLGLTHHDPSATDQDIESVLSEALEEAGDRFPGGLEETIETVEQRVERFLPMMIFSCADYQKFSV